MNEDKNEAINIKNVNNSHDTLPKIFKNMENMDLFKFSNLTKTFSGTDIKHTFSDISRINYLQLEDIEVSEESYKLSNKLLHGDALSSRMNESRQTNIEDVQEEQYAAYVTDLMKEDQLWGCFYTFPELYSDVYSPVVRVRKPEDVPELSGGVLTRDLVRACLSYLKRIPILGDFVFIKLDLSAKTLTNIDILNEYKFLVYLDLSSNLLEELTVLSYLPYLQFLSVAFNRLSTVLSYEIPQWFLTEVHYKYNSVIKIRDLSEFWSITVLDLSHNNIKRINGLENLRYLRRLNLSFNHIQRLENLNHLRLLWLDVSYNNISSFEFNQNAGLWTLLDLEYLNISENNLVCLKIFSGCTRLRELHARNNRLGVLLELAVYLRQMRRLILLDLRSNPVCSTPGYKDIVFTMFPRLLNLDGEVLDPVEQQQSKMEMMMDVRTFASRRLLRLLYIEQLSQATVSPLNPPADTTEVPLVVLVGYEAVGKGSLARRLAKEFCSKVQLAIQHTTATHHFSHDYIYVTRKKFDDMLLAGEFLTYSEKNGESYGLSREEAYVSAGKVRITTMDLIGALMLKHRGRRPYLILASYSDKSKLIKNQQERREAHNIANLKKLSMMVPQEISTLQVLLSGRIIITGILNEILLTLPDTKERSDFLFSSECSLNTENDFRQEGKTKKEFNKFALMTLSSSSFRGYAGEDPHKSDDPGRTSMYSLYKSQGTCEYISEMGQNSMQDRNSKRDRIQCSELMLGMFIGIGNETKLEYSTVTASQCQRTNASSSNTSLTCDMSDHRQALNKIDKQSNLNKSVEFTKYTSSTWKGPALVQGSTKSSKSVTFTSQDIGDLDEHSTEASGLIVEPQPFIDEEHIKSGRSISTKICGYLHPTADAHDSDIWLAFLIDAGLLQASEMGMELSGSTLSEEHIDQKMDELEFIIKQIEYQQIPSESISTNIRDDYEDIHRKIPGLFWNTILMDDPDSAFKKLKKIIHDIVDSQKNLEPMFDIDFVNLNQYTTVKSKVDKICKQLGPNTLFL